MTFIFFFPYLRFKNYTAEDLTIITLPKPSYNPHQQLFAVKLTHYGNRPEITVVDFELPLAIGASKYCEAVEFWTKT